VATAYREWALANPQRYRLAFSSSSGSGELAPDRTIPAAHRAMTVLLEALAELAPPAGAGDASALHRQLGRWADARSGGGHIAPAVLQLGVVGWTRMHGVVSLEVAGVFASMSIDPALLHAAEVDHLIAQSTTLGGGRADPAEVALP